jgi:hypothetical protein
MAGVGGVVVAGAALDVDAAALSPAGGVADAAAGVAAGAAVSAAAVVCGEASGSGVVF